MLDISQHNTTKFLRDTFFSSPNSFLWNSLNSDEHKFNWASDIHSWIGSYDKLGVMVLPFLDQNSNLCAYGFSKNDNKFETFLTELEAFIGKSWSKITRLNLNNELTDTFDISLLNEFNGQICKIEIPKTCDQGTPLKDNENYLNQNAIWKILATYRQILLKKPEKKSLSASSFGNLKRDFDKAIFVGNVSETEKKYEQLIAHGRLSFENKQFLEIRKLSGLGMWNQIVLQKQLMEECSKLPLPKKARTDLIEAFYNVSQQSEDPSKINAETAFSAFKRSEPSKFPRLFSTRQGIIRPKVIKAFIFWELQSENPDQAQIDDCLKVMKAETTEDQSFISDLEKLISRTLPRPVNSVNTSDLQIADEALDEFEHEKAFRIYQGLPPTLKIFVKLITCAKFLKTSDCYETVMKVEKQLEKNNIDIPDLVKQNAAKLRFDATDTHDVSNYSQTQPEQLSTPKKNISGWLDWSRLLKFKDTYSEDEICNYVIKASEDWSLSSLKTNSYEIKEFSDNLFNTDSDGNRVIDRVWVKIFESFLPEDAAPKKEWKPIYNALFSKKLTDDFLDENDLESIRILLSVLMESGLTHQEYADLIQDLKELVERELAVRTFEWAMDICEVISISRSPNDHTKKDFISYFLSIGHLKVSPNRLDLAQLHLVEQLSLDIGQRDLFSNYIQTPEEETTKQLEKLSLDLSNKKIGIYTLTESAGKRAKDTLEKLFPGVEVGLNNDHGGTERLKALAKNSDIFVFAAKSSTHAAFYFIKKNRDAEVLQPTGKGSSSIISAIIN